VAVAALVQEATRRSGVVWVELPGRAPRPVWHLWHDGSLYTVVGGLEQALADPGPTAVVIVRSKDTQNDQVVRWGAEVSRVRPGSPLWNEVVPLLHARRAEPARRRRPAGPLGGVVPRAATAAPQGIVMPPSTGRVIPVM